MTDAPLGLGELGSRSQGFSLAFGFASPLAIDVDPVGVQTHGHRWNVFVAKQSIVVKSLGVEEAGVSRRLVLANGRR